MRAHAAPGARRLSIAVAFIVWIGVLPPELRADYLISDFSLSGFSSMGAGYVQTRDPAGFVRITDSDNNGWGYGSISYSTSAPLDLSALSSGSMRLDLNVGAANSIHELSFSLKDVNNNEAKWYLYIDAYRPGNWMRGTARASLANPEYGNGDWQHVDLSKIKSVSVLGQFTGGTTVDFSLDNLMVQTDGLIEKYTGQDPNAAWRTEAQQRIDQLRKGNMRFVVRDADGNRYDNATVQVRMKNSAFGFGSAVGLYRLTSTSAADATYREKFLQTFNMAVDENDLKWPVWDQGSSPYSQSKSLAGLDWLAANHIKARAHNMVWPGYTANETFHRLPSAVRAMIDEYTNAGTTAARQAELRTQIGQAVLSHIQAIGAATAGKVGYWDVINEPAGNHTLMDILGPSAMVDWFNAARAADLAARLYLNETGIEGRTSYRQTNRDALFNTLAYLKANNAPLQGIGLQGHFGSSNLAGPQELWTILDQYKPLNLPVQITEFDIDSTDRELQRQFLRDYLTAAFAHESVTDFVQWGFWAGAHWKPDAALYDLDWTLRPAGEEFLRLTQQEWVTNTDLLTNGLGEAELRAFLGEYDITVLLNGKQQTFTEMLNSNSGGSYDLVLGAEMVPEPGAIGLIAVGLGLALGRRRGLNVNLKHETRDKKGMKDFRLRASDSSLSEP